jgi:hypothetical protein
MNDSDESPSVVPANHASDAVRRDVYYPALDTPRREAMDREASGIGAA